MDISQLSKLFSNVSEGSTISGFQNICLECLFWLSSTLVEGKNISCHIHTGISKKMGLGQFSRKKTQLSLYLGAVFLEWNAGLSSEVLHA